MKYGSKRSYAASIRIAFHVAVIFASSITVNGLLRAAAQERNESGLEPNTGLQFVTPICIEEVAYKIERTETEINETADEFMYAAEPLVLIEEEPIIETEETRENTLYYVIDEGYRFDMPAEWQDYLWEQCAAYGITEYYELLLAQSYHESAWDPNAVSKSNDYGLMQINKCNHEWLSETLGVTDFFDPYQSIDCGVYMMSGFLKKYNDVQIALVCYNMGESKAVNGIKSSKYSRCVVNDMEKLIILEEEFE